jgi:hypothetical protein
MCLASLSVVRSLGSADWDPTLFAAFGEEATPTRVYAEERLGDVHLRELQGHDGKFFFVQANDPWHLAPDENASVLDRPLYRSQRMLYPVLAGGAGLFGPETIVWAMIVVNVLAIAAGTVATALVATEMGISRWWGLSFALNPGVLSELNIGGSGIVAAGLAMGAVALLLRGRDRWGVALLALAALSREAMLIAAVGSAFWFLRYGGSRRIARNALLVPVAAVVGWAVYLRLRIGWESGAGQVEELGLPFQGFIEAFELWGSDLLGVSWGLVMMALFVVYVLRTVRSRHLVGWAFVGFAALGVLFTRQVWFYYYDITRAVAPLITAYLLMLFAPPLDLAGPENGELSPLRQGTTST